MNKIEKAYREMLNETKSINELEYLSVKCSTRTSQTAKKCKKLLIKGDYAEALAKGDQIAYNLGLQEFRSNNMKSLKKPQGQ